MVNRRLSQLHIALSRVLTLKVDPTPRAHIRRLFAEPTFVSNHVDKTEAPSLIAHRQLRTNQAILDLPLVRSKTFSCPTVFRIETFRALRISKPRAMN